MQILSFPKGSLRRVVAGNTVSQIAGRIISSFTTVVVSIIIARQFGPEGYGDFVKITTYLGFFYLFADFGLNAAYLQHTARKIVRPESFLSESWQMLFGLRLVISCFLVFVALCILSLFPSGLSQGYTPLVRLGIMVLAPVIIAQAITTTTNALFQKILRYDLSTSAQNIGSFFLLTTALLLSRLSTVNGPMLGVVAVFVGSVATAVVALYLVSVRIGSIRPKFSSSGFLTLLCESTPLGLALIFNLIYFHSDSIVLALTRSTQEVGIYGLAYKVFELPLVIPIFFMNSIYPLLLEPHNKHGVSSKKIFDMSFIFLFFSSLIIAGIVWVIAPLVVYVRPDFVASIEPLRVLLVGLPIFFVSALFMWFIIAQKQQRVLLMIHGIAMLANIICNIALVPAYGYMASAWVTIGSEFFVLIVTAFYVLPAVRKVGKI